MMYCKRFEYFNVQSKIKMFIFIIENKNRNELMEINPNKQAGFLMEFRNLVNPLC
jgi:hypothetical protein